MSGKYLSGIYNSVLLKDIVARLKISDVMRLESVVKYIFDNIGNLTSLSKIANTLTSMGRKTDAKTIEKYIRGLTDSLLVHEVSRYNIKGKDAVSNLVGKIVVELEEFVALRNAKSADEAKLFISARTSTVRLPYERFSTDVKRSCILIATTNDATFLGDFSGEREGTYL